MSPPGNGTAHQPVVIVTGGGSGIGAAIVRRFNSAGCRVVIADIDEHATYSLAKELGDDAVAMHCDVTCEQEEDVAKVVDDTVARFGTLNTVVNNAGICFHEHTQDLFDTDMEVFDRTNAVNFRGVFLGMKHASRAMVATKAANASIVNIASICGIRGSGKECISYQASKAGVLGLTQAGAAKLVFHGIRVNAVSPTITATSMVEKAMSVLPADPTGTQTAMAMAMLLPLRQTAMEPVEVADTVYFLASDAAKSITGVNIPVDQGWACGAIGNPNLPEPEA